MVVLFRGIRIARFWPAAGTLEWACLDDGAGVWARAVQ